MQKLPGSNIYYFNPTCEYAVANGTTSWQPNRILQKMEADLAILPLFFAHSYDKIIVPELPSESYLHTLQNIGIQSPGFILKKNINSGNINFRVNQLNPWGWSPAAHKFLAPLKSFCSEEFKKSPVFNWKPEYKNYYSKKFARDILHQITRQYPSEHFIGQNQLTEICTTKEDFEFLMQKWGKLMIKAPWSSSGRGLQPIRYKPIHPKVWAKILAIVKDQGYAIAEPYLNKVIDLAFQFKMQKGKVTFLGLSNFSTDYKGQYNGNSLNGLPDTLDPEVTQFVQCVPGFVVQPLIRILESSELARSYEGYFGVDTLIFKDENGQLKVNPCLEINVRHNMGLLSLQLEKHIWEGKKGLFRTFFTPGTSFFQYKKEMEEKHPLRIKENKIESGFFPLTEAQEDTLFGAYLLV
uniref:hypothetical protein n=1 Tax=uncultured Draconibacterium sp. TaxID=1573823 RepID=UPI003217611F